MGRLQGGGRLRWPILSIMVGFMAGVILVGVFLTLGEVRRDTLAAYRREEVALAAPLADQPAPAIPAQAARWRREFASIRDHDPRVAVLDLYVPGPKGWHVAVSTRARRVGMSALPGDLAAVRTGRVQFWRTAVGGQQAALEADVPVGGARPTAVLGVYLSLAPLERKLARDEARWALLGGGGLLVTAVFLMLFLDRRVLARLGRLVAAARAMEDGDLGMRLVPRGADELTELEEGFNRTAQALAESVALQEERRVVFRSSIADLGEAMRLGLTEEEVLRRILDSSLQVVQARAGAFFLPVEGGGLRLAVCAGEAALPRGAAVSAVVGQAFDIGRAVEEGVRDEAGLEWRVLAVPLVRGEEFLAIVAAAAPGRVAFDREDVLSLRVLGDQAALAMENLRLYREREVQANTDRLTQLANYRFFTEFLTAQAGRRVALLMVDLDEFKEINDHFGHLVGDQVLRRVARVLESAVRQEDVVCRYGGDEFVVVLPDTERELARQVAERLRAALEGTQWRDLLEAGWRVTASVGVATAEGGARLLEELVGEADAGLYLAKAQGRNRVIQAGFVPEEGASEGLRQVVREADLQVIRLLARVSDLRDRYTGEHGEETLSLAWRLAGQMGLSPRDREALEVGCLPHDIGKVGVPDQVLHKPGPLSPQERSIMEEHPLLGARILEEAVHRKGSLEAVLYHHERWDGKGYPEGLRGEEIPLIARIVAVLDAFQAMTSDRPYRGRRSVREAVSELRRGAGTQFDPRVVELFARSLAPQARQVPAPAPAED